MHGVPEFGHALLRELGAPKSPGIDTFAEVRFKNVDGKTDIPDGAIVCERGGKRWACLVEVKTGSAVLKDEQVGRYLDIARDQGFDGVLTISNQITHNATESPVCVDGRKLRKANLWHLSWWRILTEAVVQSRYRGVSDPDQAWVLRELIHYLSGDASGVVGFEDMGKEWVPVRTAAHDGTLRHGDERARQVAEHWEQFTEYLCLSLSQELGRNVTSARPRKQTTAARLDELAKSLTADGVLEATVRVPNAVGNLRIRTDLKSRQTSISVDLDAPGEGRTKPRINWLLRQLGDAWPDLRVEVWYPHARESVAATLEQARVQPESLAFPADVKREPRSFVLTLSRPMGQKRGRTEGSFVRETREQTVTFYRELVQNLKAWQAPAPQIRSEPATTDGDPPSPPDLLPLTPADRMLPQVANGVAPKDDAYEPASIGEPLAADSQGSVQGSVLSKSDPPGSDPNAATTGNPTLPDPPRANS
ncbi:MAG: stress response protein [Solirubrobacteraceae bacterium]